MDDPAPTASELATEQPDAAPAEADQLDLALLHAFQQIEAHFPDRQIAILIADETLPLGNRVTYVSNAERADVREMATELLTKTGAHAPG